MQALSHFFTSSTTALLVSALVLMLGILIAAIPMHRTWKRKKRLQALQQAAPKHESGARDEANPALVIEVMGTSARSEDTSEPADEASVTTEKTVPTLTNKQDTPAPETSEKAELAPDTAARLADTVTEVEEVDPMEEADVLISYGQTEEAVRVLCWHLEVNPQDASAFERLAGLYLDLEDEEAFVELLETYAARHGPAAASVLLTNGLLSFPDSAALYSLAQDLGDLDGASLEELAASLPDETVAPEAESVEQPDNVVYPFAAETPATAQPHGLAPVTADAAAVFALIQYVPTLDRLSAMETLVLKGFRSPEAIDAMVLGACDGEACAFHREWQILTEPLDLDRYVSLLTHHFRRRQADAYAQVLWRLFWVLGTKGYALRKRMVDYGLQLGPHPVCLGLAKVIAEQLTLQEMASRLGLRPAWTPVPAENRPLVGEMQSAEAVTMTREQEATVQDLLTTVAAHVDLGETDAAIKALEDVLLEHPDWDSPFQVLLDLYVRAGDMERFEAFQDKILNSDVQPSLEVIMNIVDTGKRIKPALAAAS